MICLVHDKPLILNPDANWNHKSSESKTYYLGYYMSKNLYRLECAVSSTYNYKTFAEQRPRAYIELKPVNFRPRQDTRKNSTGSYVNYYTNNPAAFRANPE